MKSNLCLTLACMSVELNLAVSSAAVVDRSANTKRQDIKFGGLPKHLFKLGMDALRHAVDLIPTRVPLWSYKFLHVFQNPLLKD